MHASVRACMCGGREENTTCKVDNLSDVISKGLEFVTQLNLPNLERLI